MEFSAEDHDPSSVGGRRRRAVNLRLSPCQGDVCPFRNVTKSYESSRRLAYFDIEALPGRSTRYLSIPPFRGPKRTLKRTRIAESSLVRGGGSILHVDVYV